MSTKPKTIKSFEIETNATPKLTEKPSAHKLQRMYVGAQEVGLTEMEAFIVIREKGLAPNKGAAFVQGVNALF